MAAVDPRSAILAMICLVWTAGHTVADDDRTLTVLSWGGSYERAQQQALFEPFSEATGIEVEVDRYDGGIDRLRQAAERNDIAWDVIDMTQSDALAACNEGLLQPLDESIAAPSPDGTPMAQDFIDGALTRCSLSHTVYATVIAYRRDAFPGTRPTRIADLFDQQRFPGPRALQRSPAANLEWALLSYGVPREELYRLLSTDRGLNLALQRLESLQDVHWWEGGDEPVDMLVNGEAVMASGYNGRFFDAMVSREAPIDILWDGQVQEHETWVIPRDSDNPALAREFIRFATDTERLAAFARHIPYGPARHSAATQVTTHHDSGRDMRLHIPTHPLNARRAITKDHDWYARTLDRVNERFRQRLLEPTSSSSQSP